MALSIRNQTILAWISFSGSFLSIMLGLAHVIYGLTKLPFAPKNCPFYDCNSSWRTLITLSPSVFIDAFQPILIGIVGVIYALPEGVRPIWPSFLAPPSSSIRGGLFHIVMALFCNMGYMYWVGILVASYNLLLGVAFIAITSYARSKGQSSEIVPSHKLDSPSLVSVAIPAV